MSEDRSGDIYDIVDNTVTVHGGKRGTSILNKDITLAETNEPLEDFCVKMGFHANALKNQMKPLVDQAKKESNEAKIIILQLEQKGQTIPAGLREKEVDKQWDPATDSKNSIYDEVTARLAFTRSRGGKIINSLVQGFSNIGREREEPKTDKGEEAIEAANIKGK